jgi:hypothetical protein
MGQPGGIAVDLKTVAQSIQLILAPVVMLSACTILLGGLQSRYAAVNDRLRAMVRERLELLRGDGTDLARPPATNAYATERLHQLDEQMPELLRRHGAIRDSVLAVYGAVEIFVVDMFLIGAATATPLGWLPAAVLIDFLVGMGALLYGVGLTIDEVRVSHHALAYEVNRVLALGGPGQLPPGPSTATEGSE